MFPVLIMLQPWHSNGGYFTSIIEMFEVSSSAVHLFRRIIPYPIKCNVSVCLFASVQAPCEHVSAFILMIVWNVI